MDMQSFTMCLEYLPEENHTIPKPRDYEFWRNFSRILAWQIAQLDSSPTRYSGALTRIFSSPKAHHRSHSGFPQIIDKENFAAGTYRSDIVIVNWPQIDYWLGHYRCE